MKIGIDARMYRSEVAGIGRYSQNLIKNLLQLDSKNEYIFFMTQKDADEFLLTNESKNSNVEVVITEIEHYSLAEQLKLPKIFEAEKPDLMLFLNFNHPVNYKKKFITVIHDLTLIKFPDTAKRTNAIKKMAFNYVIKSACQNAAKIIAISENTKRDIVDIFHIDPANVEVIYEAADDKSVLECRQENVEELKKKYKINEQVVLYVGQYRPHKNLPTLVDAFAKVKSQIPSKLVLVGKVDPEHHRLFESIDKSGVKNDILLTGFVTDEDLSCWYKLATVFVFPSLYEGFGLPGLEAMQAGTPVVAANNSVLPEIYKDAALYFDPFKTEEISDKIKKVLEDETLRADLIRKGKVVAQGFTWQKTAEKTLKIIKQV
ncbi:TPA: glycosyltransferase family 1 protein [Candidatus Berkelbacteria bacterium]|uniref:Group 1 glycosyl transferase n=1 Tax=Berkelbacteria bacterium GW2011_GWE1_39_12 TaxID=1618337 RepID=A0A0G4B3L6_9BACT|nr:MAG: group 1 glycosyl transferase [Berkelbacteria bacterium GW2011_GWE1_39_12]HBO60743.1 glycosyltransferase family 1 protein [Candidatus Berkelbacteria bacterium]